MTPVRFAPTPFRLAFFLVFVLVVSLACQQVPPEAAPKEPAKATTPAQKQAATPAKTPAKTTAKTGAQLDPYYTNPEQFGVEPVENRGGTLTYAASQIPNTLDPSAEISIATSVTLSSVYDRLVMRRLAPGINPLDTETICRLCESWSLADDRVTYTFKLRDGVTWHDGQPLVSQDIQTTMERLRNTAVNPGTASTGASAFAAVDRIEIVDDKTFRLITREPFAPFIESLEQAWIVPAHVYSGPDDTDTLRNTAIGTGPFRLARFDRQSGMTLEAYDDYWVEGRPWLDRIEIRFIADKSTRTAGFLAGQLDIGGASDAAELAPIRQARPNIGVQSYQSILNNGFEIQLAREPWDNRNVRLALSYAFDREEMNEQLTGGTGTAVYQAPMVSNLRPFTLSEEELKSYPGYDPARKEEDRALARQMLSDEGFPDGFRTTGKTCAPFSSTPQTLQAAAGQSPSVGIEIEVQLLEIGTCVRDRASGNFDLFLFPLRGSAQPDTAFAGLTTGNPQNYYGVSDPEYDRIYQQSRGEFDRERRYELYQELQRIAIENAYHISLIDLQPQYIWQEWVHNAREHELGVQPYLYTTTAEVVWVDAR